MKNLTLRVSVFVLVAGAAVAGSVAIASPRIRFCCTPQQSNACAASGGTASCRTGVCQCLH